MGASFSRAAQLFDSGRADLAERLVRRDLERDPSDARSHALLAMCLRRLNQHGEALCEAHEAVRLAPDLAFAQYALGVVHCAEGRKGLSQARSALVQAIGLNPRNAEFQFVLAAVEMDLRHH